MVFWNLPARIVGSATAFVLFAATASAQNGYHIGEGDNSATTPPPVTSTDSTTAPKANAGPVRLARFSYLTGNVTWRPDENTEWSTASVNLPIRVGSEVWVSDGGRAEIQFDDGSFLRLGSGAIATLQTLYSDDQGEFTEIKLNSGLAMVEAKSKVALFQVDMPLASVKSYGPSKVRVGAATGIEVAVRSGEALVEGPKGQLTMHSNEYLDLPDAEASYEIAPTPGTDGWDHFNDARDEALAHPSPYLPSNIGLVAGDLDAYGSWRDDPSYGHVWCPRGVHADWRPYHDGHWVWVDPFGWTWCGDEPWGWAPYHYGSWVHLSYGWGWCPGPAQQYWCPAVVHFTSYGGNVAWCPLAPHEVRYPSLLSVGFRSGNWSLFFSIGGAACYYPSGPSYCVARPWNNVVVNRTVNVYNVTHVTNVINVNRNVYVTNNRFMPQNARFEGGSQATTAAFATGGRYSNLSARNVDVFRTGRSFAGAPPRGGLSAGPIDVRPTRASLTPSRTFEADRRPSASVLQRPVYRAPLAPRVAQSGVPARNVISPSRNVMTAPTRSGSPFDNGSRNTTRAPSGASIDRYHRFDNVSRQRNSGTPSQAQPPQRGTQTDRTPRNAGSPADRTPRSTGSQTDRTPRNSGTSADRTPRSTGSPADRTPRSSGSSTSGYRHHDSQLDRQYGSSRGSSDKPTGRGSDKGSDRGSNRSNSDRNGRDNGKGH